MPLTSGAAILIVATILVVCAPMTLSASAVGCADSADWTGACVGSGSIDVGAGATQPGTAGGNGATGTGDGNGGGSGRPLSPVRDDSSCFIGPGVSCSPLGGGPDVEEQAGVEAVPAVTMHEIASFAPASPTLRMEPAGWAVVGLPANFIAGAETHVRSGTLLGLDAEVRFTPTRFVFDYGDGADLSAASGGASWSALGLREFSETPTSHTYGASGKFVATVSVEYGAEYRIGDGEWTTVPGSLSIPTDSPIAVTVRSARTVLVDRLCTHPRPGPGC